MLHTPHPPAIPAACACANERSRRRDDGDAAFDEYAAAVAALCSASGPGRCPHWRRNVPMALRHAVAHALMRWTLRHTSFASLVYGEGLPQAMRMENARLLRELVAQEIDHVWYGARDAAECAALLHGVPARIAACVHARI